MNWIFFSSVQRKHHDMNNINSFWVFILSNLYNNITDRLDAKSQLNPTGFLQQKQT